MVATKELGLYNQYNMADIQEVGAAEKVFSPEEQIANDAYGRVIREASDAGAVFEAFGQYKGSHEPLEGHVVDFDEEFANKHLKGIAAKDADKSPLLADRLISLKTPGPRMIDFWADVELAVRSPHYRDARDSRVQEEEGKARVIRLYRAALNKKYSKNEDTMKKSLIKKLKAGKASD